MTRQVRESTFTAAWRWLTSPSLSNDDEGRMKTSQQQARQGSFTSGMSPKDIPNVFPALRLIRRNMKRLAMWAYCNGYISMEANQRIFGWLDLRDA